MPELTSSTARAVVLPESGGRVSSLEIDGRDVIVGPVDADGRSRPAFGWGVYPMVPFAGRVRNALFAFDGVSHRLAPRAAPHAIHGTVDDVEWSVIEHDTSTITLETDLGPDWPFAGRVEHVISLSGSSISFRLSLTAEQTMPAQVGWHPWFARPCNLEAGFIEWLPRDADGMPTAPTTRGLPPLGDGVDDCFVGLPAPVRVQARGVGLDLWSDCSHWVIYTGASHGICVEPQSGPPNAIESSPAVLRAGDTLRRSFRIDW